MPEAVSTAMPVSIAKSFRARFHQAISRTRPLYTRANPAEGRGAQERFRHFVPQIASFPDLPAAEEAPPNRFRSRDVTSDAHVAPSASHHTPRHVRHSENSQSGAYSRQKLPAHGSKRAISPATRRAKHVWQGRIPATRCTSYFVRSRNPVSAILNSRPIFPSRDQTQVATASSVARVQTKPMPERAASLSAYPASIGRSANRRPAAAQNR